MSRADPHTPTIQVLERTFALLEVLASHQDPVSLKEIAERTGLHPSTAHRILNDLTIGRLVDRPEAGHYRLGKRLLELGNLVKARLDVREAALGPMRELHRLTHQPVNLSMRQGDCITVENVVTSARFDDYCVNGSFHVSHSGSQWRGHERCDRYACHCGVLLSRRCHHVCREEATRQEKR